MPVMFQLKSTRRGKKKIKKTHSGKKKRHTVKCLIVFVEDYEAD